MTSILKTLSRLLSVVSYTSNLWLACARQNSEKGVKYLNSIWINKFIFWNIKYFVRTCI